MKYRVFLVPSELGGFEVFVPALQGCVTQGHDREDSIKMAKECIKLFLDGLIEHKERITEDSELEEISVEWNKKGHLAFIVPKANGGCLIDILALPGCRIEGKSRKEVLGKLKSEVDTCLKEMEKEEMPVYEDSEIEMVEIEVQAKNV